MRKILLVIIHLICMAGLSQNNTKIRLLVRSDDMGSSHAANVACIEAVKNGISRSVEVMVPGPWFEEAVNLLSQHQDIDVGIHLVLTSEWTMVRWRPLTNAVSLRDKEGYFNAAISPYKDFKMTSYLADTEWTIEDVEKEFRAQIELAQAKIPQLSHITGHMGCIVFDEQVKKLMKRLANEYNLALTSEDFELTSFRGFSQESNKKERIKQLNANLEKLEPGDYLMVKHPALDNEEMSNVWHDKYLHVGKDRGSETYVLTHKKIKKTITKQNIELVSYADLLK